MREASGLSADEFDAQEVRAFPKVLLVNKLLQSPKQEAPAPGEEEIDLYLARQPGPNFLLLIPIEFQDIQVARTTMSELQNLKA
jgi:hypothetical protein